MEASTSYVDDTDNLTTGNTTPWEDEDMEEDEEEEDDDEDDWYSGQKDSSQTRSKTEQFLKSGMTYKEYAATLGDAETVTQTDARPSISIRRTLPPVLRCMMGEANLKFVRGDHDGALEMCLEVIREMPSSPAPFQTMAQIYEDKGLLSKSLQFGLIAAHLSPRSSDQWLHLAEMSLQQNDIQQAIYCYSKAIKYDKNNINLHLIRIQLQENINDHKSVLKSYHTMVQYLTAEHGVKILEYAKISARMYHGAGELQKAREVMDMAFKKVPSLIGVEDVNLFVELLIELKDYYKALEVISYHCDVSVEAEEDILEGNDSEQTTQFRIISCDIPATIPVDIRAQLTVLLIHTQAFHLLPTNLLFFEQFEDVEQSGDILLDIIEALMTQNKHADALKLIKRLVNTKNYNRAAVWLNYAECLKACGKVEESISAYLMVMQLAPNHIGARLSVSELLNNVGRRDEAISVLTQDPSSELINTQLLYEKCLLLKNNSDKKEELLVLGRLLLSRHCIGFKDKSELFSLSKLKPSGSKKDTLKRLQEQSIERTDFAEEKAILTLENEWELFKHLCDVACEDKQYPLLQRLVFSALGSTKFNTDIYGPDLFKMALLSCYFNKDSLHGFNLAREAVTSNIDNNVLWNMLNLVSYPTDILRGGKFIIRRLAQHPNHPALAILHANNCLVSGSFKYALSEYISCYHQEPNAYLALVIGITLLQMAAHKSVEQKNSLVTQSIAFMWQYKKYRCSSMVQEIHYNLGRTFHQLGIFPSAIFHYKKALKVTSTVVDENRTLLELNKEIAFNLSLIYKSSGSNELACYYMEKYIVF